MITEFDKDNINEYYKERFIEAFRDEDYEKAIDYLIKYSKLTDYPEFHLAMGELYLLMTQDSDDIDLCFLAYREFLMHIRRFPKCEAAYRDLLAVEYIRRDYPDVEEYRKWFGKRGMNVGGIFRALSIIGLVMPIEGVPVDLYELFKPGELGALDPIPPQETADFQEQSKPNGATHKIIEFAGNQSDKNRDVRYRKIEQFSKPEQPSVIDSRKRKSKIIKFDSNGESDFASDEEEMDEETREILDDFMQFVSNLDSEDYEEDDGEKSIDEDLLDMIEHDRADDKPPRDDIIRIVSEMYDRNDYEGALNVLSRVKPNDPQYYYALTLRGVILLERNEDGDLAAARSTLDEALRIKPGGAIASTLLCQAYENGKMTELIPSVLKAIDVTDFVNSAHVYKAFDLAIEYCDSDEALDLIEQYIEEYNFMDMRLIYAQMIYNRGERAEASNELYTLSRINYDDIHYNFFYLSSKLDVEKLPEEAEAPQEILATVVENIMDIITSGTPLSPDIADSDIFIYGLEFFFTLEFKNNNRTLKRMFDTLGKIAANPIFEEKSRDALVSPYAEPIVKGVILSELFSRDHTTDFLVEITYKHYSEDSIETPEDGYGDGVYRAYGMLLALCAAAAPSVTSLYDKLANLPNELALTERQKAYYLVKRTLKDRGITPDDRLAYAMGFRTRTEADRCYSAIDKMI